MLDTSRVVDTSRYSRGPRWQYGSRTSFCFGEDEEAQTAKCARCLLLVRFCPPPPRHDQRGRRLPPVPQPQSLSFQP
jgi:hypothetical protein